MNALLAVFLAAVLGPAWGHAMWPASWQLAVDRDGLVDSRWEVPVVQGGPLPLRAVLPSHCVAVQPPVTTRAAAVERVEQRWNCGAAGLDGATLGVEGLVQTGSDALVVVTREGAETFSELLRLEAPTVEVPPRGAGPPAASRYLGLGVEHIWTGTDHLLFVVGLVLITGARWRVLLQTVTAFTATHSITLVLSTLGLVRFPSASVEAVIALSIVLLALELTRGPETSLTHRAPWAVAGACGLLHGLGFAGALAGVGLPVGDLPAALLAFNLGVEAGQLVVVGLTLLALVGARRLVSPDQTRRLVAYGLGTVASFWFLERTTDLLFS